MNDPLLGIRVFLAVCAAFPMALTWAMASAVKARCERGFLALERFVENGEEPL